MQKGKSQEYFRIEVVLPNNETKFVDVKAATRETAERRALKRTPNAVSVKRS